MNENWDVRFTSMPIKLFNMLRLLLVQMHF